MSVLYFGIGDVEGFTSNKLADRKQGYAIPIRELLQNSLDASREFGRQCHVDVYIETIKKKDIPNIKEYEDTLNLAIRTNQKLKSYNANSENVVASIKEALKSDNIKILMFTDNGKGMPKNVLEGLLDERSIKLDESSSGSFGVGHISSYSLSSLRYVLYATKYKEGSEIKTLWTGSPILAGHEDDNTRRGSKGRVLEKEPKNKLKPDFIFPEKFPLFIKSKMDKLQETGSMVAILGLSEEWGDDAEYAIASNFFHAMSHTGLSVTVHKDQKITKIDDDKVNKLIEQRKDRMRREKQSDDILSGRMTYQAYHAVNAKGSQKSIKLNNDEEVKVCIDDTDGSSAIILIKNGMVVARHDSMLSKEINSLSKNDDYQPFTIVIDIDKDDSAELFRLVKGAENPYHNQLQSKRLNSEDEKKLKGLFKELSEAIKIHLKEIDRTGFDLPLFDMPIKGDIKGGTNSNPLPRPIGKQKPEKPPSLPKPPKICPDCEQVPCICPKPEPRPTPEINLRQLESRNATRYIDKGKTLEVRMRIKPTKQPDSKDNAYFSIALAEDNDNNKVSEFVVFESLRINNNELLKDKFMRENSQINLGQLNEADTYDIVATILNPHNFGNVKVALKPSFGLKQKQENNNE